MLRLNKDIEYCLISFVALGEHSCTISSRELSRRFHIPFENLSKVLQRMAQRGLVESIQGPKGGYRLRRGLDEISLAEVIQAVQGPVHLAPCNAKQTTCAQEKACAIRPGVTQLQALLVQFLEEHSLQELLSAAGAGNPHVQNPARPFGSIPAANGLFGDEGAKHGL